MAVQSVQNTLWHGCGLCMTILAQCARRRPARCGPAILVAAAACLWGTPGGAASATAAQAIEFEEIARVDLPYGRPHEAAVRGNQAYLANGNGGLVIADLADPKGPKLLGRLITGNIGHRSLGREWINESRGSAVAVSVASRYVYLMTAGKGYDVGRAKIHRIDVSDPKAPAPAGEYLLSIAANHLAAIDDTRVCVAAAVPRRGPQARESGFFVIDFSEPGRARLAGALGHPPQIKGRTFYRVAAARDVAVVCAQDEKQRGSLHVIGLADPAAPSLLASVPCWGGCLDVALDAAGKVAYVADAEAGIGVVELADPARPRIAFSLEAPNKEVTRIAVCGTQGLALAGKSIVRLDLDSPLAPRLAASRNLGYVSTTLSAAPGLAVLADADRGLITLPLTDRNGFGRESSLPTVGEATGLKLDRQTLYVTIAGQRPRAFDVRDPQKPRALGRPTPEALGPSPQQQAEVLLKQLGLDGQERINPQAALVRDKIAYLAAGRDGLRTIDLGDPAQPALLGRFYDADINRMSASDVKVVGRVAYLADLDNGLYLLDVADPSQPRRLSRLHAPNAHTVDVSGSVALLANGVYGLEAIDVSDPARPAVLGSRHGSHIRFNAALWGPVAEGQSPQIAFVADAGAIRVFRLKPSTSAPPLESIELVGHVKLPMGIPDVCRVSDDGRTALLVNDEGWNFISIDISDPARPTLRSVAATGGFAHGFALRGNTAFVCNNRNYCTFFDVSRPDSPKIVGAIGGFKKATTAAVQGDALFVCCSDGTLCLIDVADLKRPQRKAAISDVHPGGFTVGQVEGRRYLLRGTSDGLEVFDVSDLERPAKTGELAPKRIFSPVLQDRYVYAAGEREFLAIRFDPAAPRIVGRCEAPKGVCGVSVNGKTACFGGPSVGLVDVSDPARPVILGQIAAQRHEGTYGGPDPLIISTHVFSRQGHEYVAAADHYWGLRLYDAADRRRPREIGDFPTSGGDFTGIQAEGRRVYVGNNWGGVYIADVSNPQRPRLIGGTRRMLQPNRGSAGLLAEDNRLFFQGNTNRTLYIADVTDAARPALLGQYCLPEQGREFGDNRRFGCTFPQRNGRRLYTPGFARVFDVSDPRGPRLVGECPEVGFANDVCALATIAGRDYLVIGEYYSGLTVLRLGEGGPAMGLGPSQAGRAN